MSEKKLPHQTSPVYCALIMVTVLGLSLAAAMLLCKVKNAGVQQGRAILADMCKAGLDKFLPPAAGEQWYLLKEDNQIIGWRCCLIRNDGGNLAGLAAEVHAKAGEQAGQWEVWKLDNNASAGDYLAGDLRNSDRIIGSQNTEISLAAGRVQAKQLINGSWMYSHNDRPDSYIPEGMMEIVARQVGKLQTRAVFKTILNPYPPAGSKTSFISVSMEYVGQSEGIDGADVSIEFSIPGMPSEPRIYSFASDGRLVRSKIADVVEEYMDKSKVLAAFPAAQTIVKALGQPITQDDSLDSPE